MGDVFVFFFPTGTKKKDLCFIVGIDVQIYKVL